jgi:colanic acid biosynthesis glycosyl transferase WcaI
MLLLCINFAPELAGIAPYTSALANHLAESVDVNVVTTYPHYPEWKKRDAPKTEFVLSKTGFALGLQRVWHYLPKKMNFVSRFLMEISFAHQ